MAALNLELERAREVAARRRLEGGCSSFATIEVKSFQLPNPGGGADLLEEAACVLVPGHRRGPSNVTTLTLLLLNIFLWTGPPIATKQV